MFVPIFQLAQLNGVRARVEQSGIGLIDYLPYSLPYEDLRLKSSRPAVGERGDAAARHVVHRLAGAALRGEPPWAVSDAPRETRR